MRATADISVEVDRAGGNRVAHVADDRRAGAALATMPADIAWAFEYAPQS